jgi:pimeloyl-ACP methyl ester carboxylesterase
MGTIHYLAADVDGLKISYREAGRTDAPTLLLLHGFPSAGHMFPTDSSPVHKEASG